MDKGLWRPQWCLKHSKLLWRRKRNNFQHGKTCLWQQVETTSGVPFSSLWRWEFSSLWVHVAWGSWEGHSTKLFGLLNFHHGPISIARSKVEFLFWKDVGLRGTFALLMQTGRMSDPFPLRNQVWCRPSLLPHGKGAILKLMERKT